MENWRRVGDKAAFGMRPSSCKDKGRRLQKLVVAQILAAWPHLTDDDVRSCSMGAGGEDVQLSPMARECFPYSVECKNTERVNVWNAMQQARANANGHTPCVIIKKNHEQPLCVVSLPEFMRLAAGGGRGREQGGDGDDGARAMDEVEDSTAPAKTTAFVVAAELRRLAEILDSQ